MSQSFELLCEACGTHSSGTLISAACPNCGSGLLTPQYDLENLAVQMRTALPQRGWDMWRYRELLPIERVPSTLSMGEGGTPLYRAENLGMMLGLENLYIKDERQGPTASFKDRQAAVSIAALKEAGHTDVVVASTGNVAISFSAYGARAGIKVWAFLTSLVPAAKMHEVALYGTQVLKVTSTYDQAKQLAGRFAAERGFYFDRGTQSPLSIEAMKTIAYEICEQLGEPDREGFRAWNAPDWYLQSVSGGIGPLGVQRGFSELHRLGWIDDLPALGLIQTEGCAPMARAWRKGDHTATPVKTPSTHISTLSTGDPGEAYRVLRDQMLHGGGGVIESVTDEEAFRALQMVAKMEGLSVEPAVGVTFAGLIRLVQRGQIGREQVVVVNCSGHTMPVEEELLQDGWHEDIDLSSGVLPERPQEGLLAALARLDDHRSRSVLIIDDHPDARRLIRRILQAQGNFQVQDAANGKEALDAARHHPPNLIILDLMMPEMDGFEVLDHLRALPEASDVPVIVVTAKELTVEEKRLLEGRISRLMMKGDFLNDDLIKEISRVLES